MVCLHSSVCNAVCEFNNKSTVHLYIRFSVIVGQGGNKKVSKKKKKEKLEKNEYCESGNFLRFSCTSELACN